MKETGSLEPGEKLDYTLPLPPHLMVSFRKALPFARDHCSLLLELDDLLRIWIANATSWEIVCAVQQMLFGYRPTLIPNENLEFELEQVLDIGHEWKPPQSELVGRESERARVRKAYCAQQEPELVSGKVQISADLLIVFHQGAAVIERDRGTKPSVPDLVRLWLASATLPGIRNTYDEMKKRKEQK